MLKTLCKNLVWCALPLGLVVGCAENRPTEAAYEPAPSVVLQPTSSEPEQRIYSTTDPAVESTSTSVTSVPAGASSQSWAVAEEIRQKLTADTTLVPLGSRLIASVGSDGMVTLRGNVSSPSEQDRVYQSISSLPGVHGVNNELKVGRFDGSRSLNMQ